MELLSDLSPPRFMNDGIAKLLRKLGMRVLFVASRKTARPFSYMY